MNRDQILHFFLLMGFKNVKKTDGWVMASCPFAPFGYHKGTDQHPSFGVSIKNPSHYNCLACQNHGLAMALPTALLWLGAKDNPKARAYVISNETWADGDYEMQETIEPTPLFDWAMKDFPAAPSGIIASRGITAKTAKFYDLRYDKYRKRLLFPVRDMRGRIVGLRGRSTAALAGLGGPPKYLSYKELHPQEHDPKQMGVWHGMGFLPVVRNKFIPLVEGEINGIKLWQSGLISNVPWSGMGASVSRAQLSALQSNKNPLLIAFDDDPAGKLATDKVIEAMTGLVPMYRISDYQGENDLDDLYEAGLLETALKSIMPV